MNVAQAALGAGIGFLAGLHTSTWGMYKDSPHEGFGWARYFRSALVGLVLGLAAQPFTGLDLRTAAGAAVFFGFVYVLERAAIEFWKTFLRHEDQSKYFIPMQFAVFGQPVRGRGARLAIGAAYALGVFLIAAGALWVQRRWFPSPSTLVLVLLGSAGGWISAFGGAWKDAPHEGFETLKFFRSPAVSATWAFLLSRFTNDLVLVGAGALGYTIASIETYKTFFFPSRPRGKFAGKPVLFPEMLARRNRFVPAYAAIWLLVLALFVQACRGV